MRREAVSTQPVRAPVDKERDRRVLGGFESLRSTKVFKIYEYGDNSNDFFRSLLAACGGKRVSGHRPDVPQIR